MLLLGAWVLVAAGIGVRRGLYAPAALALVCLGLLLAGAAVWRLGAKGRPGRLAWLGLSAMDRVVRLGTVAVVVAGVTVWAGRFTGTGALSVASLGLAGGAAAVATLPVVLGARDDSRLFWAALVLAVLASAALVRSAPDPRIDVFYLLQGSTRGLLAGADMYRQQWAPSRAAYHSHGLFDVYPYLPGTSLLLAPLRLLLGDVRYGLVAASAVAAVLLRRLLRAGGATHPGAAVPRRTGLGSLLPLLVLVLPRFTYLAHQAWTEPLLLVLLVGAVLAVVTRHPGWAVAALAAALASKQHVALLLPVAAMWPAFGVRRTLAAAGAGALVVAPWVLAGPRDFWHDAVSANLDLGYRADALCVPAVLHRARVDLGADLGAGLLGVGLLGVGLLAAYALAYRARGSARGFAAGSALVVLTLDVLNQQSFFNHYVLGLGLLVLALAAPARHGSDRTPEPLAGAEPLQPGAFEQPAP